MIIKILLSQTNKHYTVIITLLSLLFYIFFIFILKMELVCHLAAERVNNIYFLFLTLDAHK